MTRSLWIFACTLFVMPTSYAPSLYRLIEKRLNRMRILITGGAGFIGSALIRHLIGHTDHQVLNLDKLTYAGNLESLSSIDHDLSLIHI